MKTHALAPAHVEVSVLLAAASLLFATSLHGQELAVPPPRVAVEATLDLTSRYLFRGYELDSRGAVFQPSATVGFTVLSHSSGALRELSAGAVAWSSVHAGTRAYPGQLGWFEVDLSADVSAGFSNGWTAGLVYTSYLAPDAAFDVIHEIAAVVGLGTIGRPGTVTVMPTVLVAQEFHDAGSSEDTYLELGGDVELPTTGVISWTVPVTVGMSIDGYYRNVSGGNEWFGFLGSGLEASAELAHLGLPDLPGGLTGAVDFTVVNDEAELAQDPGNRVLWTARMGLSVAF